MKILSTKQMKALMDEYPNGGIVFVPSKEDSDRITCGNALISGDINKN